MSRTLTFPVVTLLACCVADAAPLREQVAELCRKYLARFGSATTHVVYHHRLDGPRGLDALSSPEEIRQRLVRGKPMPYGYGSGIQDVALENGHFLYALCDAYEATRDPFFGETARRIFQGLKLVATVSHVPGFVPRGPHPDGKSYYPNSSRDQHCAFVEAMWRYSRSPLATAEDKRFIANKLDKVARRMESNGWKIMVEDGSAMAHVGFGWTQWTSIGSLTLLSVLAEAHDATDDAHWRELYDKFSAEKDGERWRRWLHPDAVDNWPPFTLYSNQFAVGLNALARIERDEARCRQLKELMRRLAERSLRLDVFDPRAWRRADWAGDGSEEETESRLKPFGLTLRQKATVFEIYRAFNPQQWATKDRTKSVSGKLLFGIPTVAFHKTLLSADPALVAEVAPCVRDMVAKMLTHGHFYTGGENFNRAVVLGLHLTALETARCPAK